MNVEFFNSPAKRFCPKFFQLNLVGLLHLKAGAWLDLPFLVHRRCTISAFPLRRLLLLVPILLRIVVSAERSVIDTWLCTGPAYHGFLGVLVKPVTFA